MPNNTPTITNLVSEASAELTPTERRIAEVILSEPTLLAFGTVSDLAHRVGASRPSIVRFANKLGFDGYTQLQELIRADVSRQLTRPSERIRKLDKSTTSQRHSLEVAIDSVFAVADGKGLLPLVKRIARARRVWILSGETSLAGAYTLQSGLSMIRPSVQLMNDHKIGCELGSTDKRDVAVVFDFFRYRKFVVETSRILANAGVKVVAITDGPLSPLVELADAWCEISVPAIGPFDSSVSVVAIAEMLVSGVANELQEKATERVDRIENLWEAAGVYCEDKARKESK